MSEELKPCPFCGGEAMLGGGYCGYSCDSSFDAIECKKCGTWGLPYYTKNEQEEAIKHWNTRADVWISVEDALPTEDGSCWVAFMVDGELYQCEGYYFTRTKIFDTDYTDFPDILFWRKLPELPVIK